MRAVTVVSRINFSLFKWKAVVLPTGSFKSSLSLEFSSQVPATLRFVGSCSDFCGIMTFLPVSERH